MIDAVQSSSGGGRRDPTVESSNVYDVVLEAQRPIPTGKFIVTFNEGAAPGERREALKAATDGRVETTGFLDVGGRLDLLKGSSLIFEDIGVAIISPSDEIKTAAMTHSLATRSDVLESRPAYYFFAVDAPYGDTTNSTWGVDAVGASRSDWTGRGIKIAVLDTGFDLKHPDFRGRTIVPRNFTATAAVDDFQGHGTHCAGTAAGPLREGDRLRYGVAPEADLYIAKVLDDSGKGEEDQILDGLRWAIANKCEVISMSLGRTVRRNEAPSPLYERLGQLALDQGCLIVAAAGNDSARASGFIAPVAEPANTPSFMAVAAVDQALDIAYFSNGGINPAGGEVDLAGPGVNVFSSAPDPRLYRTLGGTSMACPHVAGVAALWAEYDPSLRGRALRKALTEHARPLKLPTRDVGAGLVQGPPAPSS